jgi:3-methyladenine DNA glycosylase/8-oxoguanine DNA glycosylase
MQHADTFAAGDLVARRALRARLGSAYGLPSSRDVSELATEWSPFRSYALVYLWLDSAYA